MDVDHLELPAMKGSHGTKPAVGPYRLKDPRMLRNLTESTLEGLVQPWQGDRLSETLMRGMLTLCWFTLEHLDGEDLTTWARWMAEVEIENLEEVDAIPDLIATLTDVIERLQSRWDGEFRG
jgi:hypothetical protein